MKSNLILFLVLLCFSTEYASAQNANPFDLLWRKDAPSNPAVIPAPTPVPITPAPIETPAEQVIADTQKISPEVPPPEVIDTAADASDFVTPETTHTGDSVAGPAGASIEPQVVPPGSARVRKSIDSPLFFVILFAIVFSLLAWVLSLNREVLQKIYRAALNENLSSLLFREQRFATTQYLYYTIYVIFFLNAGMFLYFLSRQFGWDAWALSTVLSCITIVFVVYMLRHIWMAILGSTYPVTKEMTHFSFSILLHNILLGIALIPVNLFLAFGPEGMYKSVAVIGILLCGLVYLMRQFRGLVISGSAIGTHPFHFFVYLCAVEILPLFTLVKFFHN